MNSTNTVSFGTTSASGYRFNTPISNINQIIIGALTKCVYHSCSNYFSTIQFVLLDGTTQNYGGTPPVAGSYYSFSIEYITVNLAGVKINEIDMRSGMWLDDFQLHLYNPLTDTEEITQSTGGTGGGSRVLNSQTLNCDSIEFTSIGGFVDQSQGIFEFDFIRSFELSYRCLSCS